jgi:hypothetical protein
MSSSHGYPNRYKVRDCVGGRGKISKNKIKGEIQVGVKRFPPMYGRSAKFSERDRWICGGFPQCTEVSRVKGNGNQQSEGREKDGCVGVPLRLYIM